MTTVAHLTPNQRGALADAVAASGRWERVAELCDVDPADVRAPLPGQRLAAATECARALLDLLKTNAFPLERLRSALVDAQLRGLASDARYGLSVECARKCCSAVHALTLVRFSADHQSPLRYSQEQLISWRTFGNDPFWDPEQLFGRDIVLERILSHLESNIDQFRHVLITGDSGIGKTSLARRVLSRFSQNRFSLRKFLCHQPHLRGVCMRFGSKNVVDLLCIQTAQCSFGSVARCSRLCVCRRN
jgi:hypothetical protein